MTTSISRRGTSTRKPLSGLKVIYRDLVRASEFAVKFHYGRPWETARATPSAHPARTAVSAERASEAPVAC